MATLDEEGFGTEGAGETVEAVATPARAAAVIAGLVGSTIAFGPVAAGPGGMAMATADGDIGRITARRAGPALVAVAVPVELDVSMLIGRRTVPVEVSLVVHLRLRARMASCRTVIDVDLDDIAGEDVEVESRTSGVGGVLVRRLGDLDEEIRTQVRTYVSDLLATAEAAHARRRPVVV